VVGKHGFRPSSATWGKEQASAKKAAGKKSRPAKGKIVEESTPLLKTKHREFPGRGEEFYVEARNMGEERKKGRIFAPLLSCIAGGDVPI